MLMALSLVLLAVRLGLVLDRSRWIWNGMRRVSGGFRLLRAQSLWHGWGVVTIGFGLIK